MNRSSISNLTNTESPQPYVIVLEDSKHFVFLFSTESESIPSTISKAEREQIQKFYRAELIQHLTNWPATQLEKQVKKAIFSFLIINSF
jgi:hypothetical protein